MDTLILPKPAQLEAQFWSFSSTGSLSITMKALYVMRFMNPDHYQVMLYVQVSYLNLSEADPFLWNCMWRYKEN